MRKRHHDDELYHYGVKGMKWGVRRFQDKSGRLTAAGKKRYSEKSLIEAGKMFVAGSMTKTAVDPVTGFNMLQTKQPVSETIKAVNPKFSAWDRSSYMNCGNCTIATEMRMRGYDVSAMGNPNGMKWTQLGSYFKGMNQDQVNLLDSKLSKLDIPDINTRLSDKGAATKSGQIVEKAVKESIISDVKSKNASGAFFCPTIRGSHWINWTKEGNKVNFYDGQNPKRDLTSSLFGLYVDAYSIYGRRYPEYKTLTKVIRLDNLEINEKYIHEVVQNSDKKFKRGSFDVKVDRGEDFVIKNLKG